MGKTFWKRIGLLFLLSLFLLFSCWWYGLFTDIGKTVKEPYDLDKIQYPDGIINLDYPDPMIDLKKQLSKMPTRTVAETLLQQSHEILICNVYSYPQDALKTYSQYSIYGEIIAELLSRNNTASILLDMYQECRLVYQPDDPAYPTYNTSAIGMLELLLTSSAIQQHMLLQDKIDLPQIVYQKQFDKVTSEDYKYGEYNYFYSDTYEKSDYSYKIRGSAEGWDYRLLLERVELIKDSQKQHHVLECLEKMWPAVTRADDWKRFDDCQI